MSIKKKLFTFLVCLPFTANAQWVQLNSPGDEYIIMSVVNKDTLVYSNDSDGKIYHTFNGGETWSDFQNVISNIWINDFDFVTDQVGYACGGSYNETNNKVIFKTPNAGLTWDTVSVSPASFLDSGSLHGIDFLNSDTGFVCSDSRLFRTIDGGQTIWPIQFSQSSSINITDIYVTPGEVLFLFGNEIPAPETYYSLMYRSADLGETWSLVYADTLLGVDYYYTRFIHEMDFPTSDVGYAVGGSGTFLKTTDGGLTWDQIESDLFPHLYMVDFLSPDTGFINSLNGIYRTNDGAENWDLQYIHDLPIDVHDVQFATSDIGYAVVDYSIYKTTNGGYLTSVSEQEMDLDIQVFPNPSNDILKLTYPSEIEIQKIELIDIMGRTIASFSERVYSIDVNQLTPGSYLLRIETHSGRAVKKVFIN